jgi:hypothetical protein
MRMKKLLEKKKKEAEKEAKEEAEAWVLEVESALGQ